MCPRVKTTRAFLVHSGGATDHVSCFVTQSGSCVAHSGKLKKPSNLPVNERSSGDSPRLLLTCREISVLLAASRCISISSFLSVLCESPSVAASSRTTLHLLEGAHFDFIRDTFASKSGSARRYVFVLSLFT